MQYNRHFQRAGILLVDMIAHDLGIDPVEIRLKNAVQSGDVTANGWKITSCGLSESILKAAEVGRWQEKKGKLPPYRGIGNQSSAYSFGTQVAEVEVDPETGKVKVLQVVDAHDCGFAINPLADGPHRCCRDKEQCAELLSKDIFLQIACKLLL